MLPLGTESGEDDDPALARARDGSYHLAWLSNRTGNAEIFAARSADGLNWGKPVRVTNHDFQDWYPTLLQASDGTFHLVWMRVTPPPNNFQHLWYNRSVDGLTWDPSAEVQITTGAVNDFAPNLACDAEGNLLVFFSGAVRSKNGTSDLFVVRSLDKGTNWEEPRALSTLSTPTDMEVFPWVARRNDGSFMMVFSRHDSTRGANYFHAKWTLIWMSTAMSNPPKGEVVEIDVDNRGQYPDGVTNWTDRIGAGGWSPRVVATGTPSLYLMLSVCRVKGTAKIHSQIYKR
ncbi:MAG: sialidase family protein [Planctomycetota bacterium]